MKRVARIITLVALLLWACSDATNRADSATDQPNESNSMTHPVRIITISIDTSPDAVYQFASNPENFPKWVDFVESITRDGDLWIGKTKMGDIKIRFCPINKVGVLDHEVTLPNGQTVLNPMRVVPNNDGSQFTFILFWMPGRPEKEFNEDAEAVRKDLQNLKEILERSR